MNQTELLAAIRKAQYCFAYVHYSCDEGLYVRVTKAALITRFSKPAFAAIIFKAEMSSDSLYIN